jgi:uncharacterized protein (DUF58 family)
MTPVTLGTHRLYILPTRPGLIFAAMIAVLLLASVNYSNGLGYGLTFIVASVALVSMLYTHRNLAGLEVLGHECAPVHAGEVLALRVCLHNPAGLARIAIQVEPRAGAGVTVARIAPYDQHWVTLTLPTAHRGRVPLPALVISTRFPFGLLHSWSRSIALDGSVLVYPRPAPQAWDSVRGHGDDKDAQTPDDGDDFAGLRRHRTGDAPQRVHWKAVARGQGMHTKEFQEPRAGQRWLDWDAVPLPDVEERLSVLCRAVLDADREGARYGLRLPGTLIEPDTGARHRHRCLEALALFPTTGPA